MQNIRLTTATDVLAAIPALLGFVPTDSVVMVALTEPDGEPATLAFVARTDAVSGAVGRYSEAVTRANVAAVIWIVVGIDQVAAAGLDHIEEAQRELDSLGIRSIRTLVAQSLEAGARWFDMNGQENGLTEDPALSATSLARMINGHKMSNSRAEIEARYIEDQAADMDVAHTAAREEGDEFAQTTIAEFAAVVRNFEAPSLDLAARIGLCAAMDVSHRDALTGVVTISAAAAVDAFTTVAAHLRGNYRAQILTLAGLAAYVAGDGTVAGIAFYAAHNIEVDPSKTTLLQLLEKSLAAGIRPEAIAELVTIGVEVARTLGVDFDTE